MSQNIASVQDENESNHRVDFTSFFGGQARGRCLQLSQWERHMTNVKVIQMTRSQVEEAIEVMQAWLDGATTEEG